jgi:hypothetical protein
LRSATVAGESHSVTVPMKTCHLALCATAALVPIAFGFAQPPGTKGSGGPGPSREAEALAEPFRGITTNGTVQTGLFTVKSTGVSTEPVRKAATAFLAALQPEQRSKTTFPVDDPEWRKWMNVHRYTRQGVSFQEMTESQRAAAFGLLKASLSAKGLKLSQDIMKLNHTLGELNNDNFTEYGEWLYHITVMGEPSADKPWGWQIDGHHLIINYFVLRDQVVMSPAFYGSEPVIARSGKYQGVSILQDEQSRGLAMLKSLTPDQRKLAVLDANKTGNNNVAEAFKDNVVLDYAGIAGAKLTAEQQAGLLKLAGMFINNMDDGHAKVKMEEVSAHLDRTYFAWIGGDADDSVYYYRIHSPVVLIEFDHQRPANTRHLAKNPQLPIRDHIHVVVRTPNGNDYGKDLLRQHYAASKH